MADLDLSCPVVPVASAGVDDVNSITDSVIITGAGEVGVTTGGQTITISGTPHTTGGGSISNALIGADGITVTSGSNTDTLTGFRTEFVNASGSLQSDLNAIDLQAAYDNGSGAVVLDGTTKPVVLSGTIGDLFKVMTPGDVVKFQVRNNIVTATIPIRGAAGSASFPSLTFDADTNTGIYNVANNVLGITAGGLAQITVAPSITTITKDLLVNDEITAATGTYTRELTVSGIPVLTQIDAHIANASAHHIRYTKQENDAITGSDGITIVSGSNTIDVQGFRTEFTSASGSLQTQIAAVEASDVDSLTVTGTALIGDITLSGLGGTSLFANGQVITISGLSSEELENLKSFGELYEENDSGTTITVTTGGTFTKWTTSVVGQVSPDLTVSGSATNDNLTILENGSGDYIVSHSESFAGTNTNNVWTISVFRNGARIVGADSQWNFSNANRRRNAASATIARLEEGDVIDLRFRSASNSRSIILYRANLSVARIGRTGIGSAGGGVTDHGNLDGLNDDDHALYSRVDGVRPFTSTVGGVTPTVSTHLTTKGYVDNDTSKLAASGVATNTNIVNVSGHLQSEINAVESSDVDDVNSVTGNVIISGAGEVNVTTAGQTITISGTDHATGDTAIAGADGITVISGVPTAGEVTVSGFESRALLTDASQDADQIPFATNILTFKKEQDQFFKILIDVGDTTRQFAQLGFADRGTDTWTLHQLNVDDAFGIVDEEAGTTPFLISRTPGAGDSLGASRVLVVSGTETGANRGIGVVGNATVTGTVFATAVESPTGTFSESLTVSGLPVLVDISSSVDTLQSAYDNGDGSIVLDGTSKPVVITGTSDDLFKVMTTGDVVEFEVRHNIITATNPFRSADGSESIPTYSFTDDSNTGIYRVSENTLGISTAGVAQLTVSDSAVTADKNMVVNHELTAATGTFSDSLTVSGLPVITDIHSRYTKDENDALTGSDGITVISGGNTIDIQGFRTEFVNASGVLQADINAIDSSVTLQEAYDNGTGEILLDGVNKPVLITGTLGNMLQILGNGNANLLTAEINSVSTDSRFRSGLGSAALPSFAFNTDGNTGMYNVADNQLGFSAASTLQLTVRNQLVEVAFDLDVAKEITAATGTYSDELTVSGIPVVTSFNVVDALTVSGLSDITGTIDFVGSNGVNVSEAGNTITIDGAGIATGSPDSLQASYDGGNTINLAAGTDLDITANDSSRFVIDGDTGYTGVGTNTPSERLHVVGSGIFSLGVAGGTSTSNNLDLYGPAGAFHNTPTGRIKIHSPIEYTDNTVFGGTLNIVGAYMNIAPSLSISPSSQSLTFPFVFFRPDISYSANLISSFTPAFYSKQRFIATAAVTDNNFSNMGFYSAPQWTTNFTSGTATTNRLIGFASEPQSAFPPGGGAFGVIQEFLHFATNPHNLSVIHTRITVNNYTHFKTNNYFSFGTVLEHIGVDVGNLNVATTLTIGYRSQITAGTNKWGFRDTGGAVNSFLGKTKFGATTVPLEAVDVQGNVTVNGNVVVSGTTGRIGAGQLTPTARIHFAAGTATASTAPLKFAAGTNLTTPEAGAMEFDGSKLYTTKSTAIREAISSAVFTKTADTAVANTVTETSLIGTGVGTGTLPANFLAIGKTIRIKARGIYSTTTGSPTLIFRVKLGSTVIVATATNPATDSLTNRGWDLDADIVCRTTGSSGTTRAQGKVFISTGNATSEFWEMASTANVTVNTTTSQAVSATVQWGTADALNTITCTNLTIEIIY